MKRFLPALLCAALLLALPVTAAAEDDVPEWSVRTSAYGPSASMSASRALFTEAERLGLSAPLTRAMTAVILARYDGVPEEPGTGAVCTDIDPGAWYAFGANWAYERGILPATEDGLFHPEQTMDRESLCLALRRYLTESGRTLSAFNPWYSFLDAGTMSPDGRQAAAVMQEAGVLIEEHDGFFYPFNPVTVAEAEGIFLRFFGGLRGSSFPTLPVSTVEASAPVEKSWFDDACFIGHSQVVGMANYFDLDNADYYCVVGHTAQDVLDFPYYQGPDKRYGTLSKIMHNFPDAYGKVYIMLGINDCNTRENRIEEFMRPMREILDLVCETQPNATIYLLSLAPVGRETPLNIAYNPENTILYSQAIKTLSREYGTEYLDIFRLMADSEGYFLDRFNAGDGIHIQAGQYPVIEEFIKCHTGS